MLFPSLGGYMFLWKWGYTKLYNWNL